MVSVLTDLSSQQEIQRQILLLGAVVEQAGEAILIIDLDGKIRYVNRYFEITSGYTAAEVLGEAPEFLKSGIQPDEFYQHMWQTILSGKIWSGTFANRCKDGSLAYMDTTIFPIKDADQVTIGYGMVQRDATDRALTEAQLNQQLVQIRTLYEISQSLAGTVELDATLQLIAEASSKLIPASDCAVLHLLDESGKYLEAVAVAGSNRPETTRRMNFKAGQGIAGLALSTGQTINVADVAEDPRYLSSSQGQAKPHFRSLLVAPIQICINSPDSAGSAGRYLGTLSVQSQSPGAFDEEDERLLTTLGSQAALAIDKVKLVADLQAALRYEQVARAQLVQSEKLAALGRTVASVAHEMNNPLQAIQNALYLIRMEEQLSEQAQQDLQTVLTETERMVELIARLRETYRPAVREEYQDESINRLVLEVQRLLAAHLRQKRIEMDFQPAPDLPEVPIIRDQFKQVILNVCMNAIEAMLEGGRLTIRTGLTRRPAPGVECLISDTGPGISPSILPYIFDHFVTTKEGGTGLGLAISYDIVQRHNGQINVISSPGEGATFRIWLPLGDSISAASPRELSDEDGSLAPRAISP